MAGEKSFIYTILGRDKSDEATSAAARGLQKLGEEVKTAGGVVPIDVKLDTNGVETKLREIKDTKGEITLDTSKARAEVDSLKSSVDHLDVDGASSKWERFRGGMEKAGVAALAVGAGLSVVGDVLEHSVVIGMSNANARVALGDEAFGKLTAAASANAAVMGQTTAEYINTAGQVAILARNMGFTADQSAAFGQALPKVADNLAMLSSGALSSAEASDVLRSALAGEYDPLQAVGIAISANLVSQEQLNVKAKEGANVTDLQAQAMAVMNIVSRQTATATDVAATAEGQHVQAIEKSKAAIGELYDKISGQLLPVLGDMAQSGNTFFGSLGDSSVSAGDKFLAFTQMVLPGAKQVDDALARVMQTGSTAAPVMFEAAFADGEMAKYADQAKAALDREAIALAAAGDASRKKASAALDAREADRQFVAAIDAATASLLENGKTLEDGTVKGRANQAALDDIAAATLREVDAMGKAGSSQLDMSIKMDQGRAALILAATQMGLNSTAAQALADQILAIPAAQATTFTSPGLLAAIAQSTTLKGSVQAIPVTQNTAYTSPGLLAAISQADTLHGSVLAIPTSQSTNYTAPGLLAAISQSETLRSDVQSVPTSHSTSFTSPGLLAAISQAQSLQAALNSIPTSISVGVTIGVGGATSLIGRAGGGWVPGAPSPVDNTTIAAASGEYVVNADAAARWGPVLEAINSGGSPGSAVGSSNGGAGGGGTTIYNYTTVQAGAIGNEEYLVRVLDDAVGRIMARGGGS